ncbi:MAG: IS200/IS605 family transposase [Cytophagaceae bacterium]
MANTFTQLYYHIVFSTKNRTPVINEKWESKLYQYIAGIGSNKNQKILLVNGYKDHIHILISLNPNACLSDVIRDIKSGSTKYINDNNFVNFKFYWQEGYGAFSCSSSQIEKIYRYIKNQKEHHQKQTFKEEYISFLKLNQIEFDERYVFG